MLTGLYTLHTHTHTRRGACLPPVINKATGLGATQINPSMRQHKNQPPFKKGEKKYRQSSVTVVGNILAAAVTHLISDERRANSNNMIKQEIN